MNWKHKPTVASQPATRGGGQERKKEREREKKKSLATSAESFPSGSSSLRAPEPGQPNPPGQPCPVRFPSDGLPGQSGPIQLFPSAAWAWAVSTLAFPPLFQTAFHSFLTFRLVFLWSHSTGQACTTLFVSRSLPCSDLDLALSSYERNVLGFIHDHTTATRDIPTRPSSIIFLEAPLCQHPYMD